jgi:hypothetical protein
MSETRVHHVLTGALPTPQNVSKTANTRYELSLRLDFSCFGNESLTEPSKFFTPADGCRAPRSLARNH